MEIIAKYRGYDDNLGMGFLRSNGHIMYIRDGEMSLKIGNEYKITAHGFEVGSYGDDLIITDYEIEEKPGIIDTDNVVKVHLEKSELAF